MTYQQECIAGRERAADLIRECAETGNLPKLLREIRYHAADEGGNGVGFLFELAERATAREAV